MVPTVLIGFEGQGATGRGPWSDPGATIIPGHGRPMRPADIEFPLRYLRELNRAVRAAIEEGQSFEATLDVAAMTNYGAYTLFEWAHNTANVPAAFRDLQNTATEELSGRSTHERI